MRTEAEWSISIHVGSSKEKRMYFNWKRNWIHLIWKCIESSAYVYTWWVCVCVCICINYYRMFYDKFPGYRIKRFHFSLFLSLRLSLFYCCVCCEYASLDYLVWIRNYDCMIWHKLFKCMVCLDFYFGKRWSETTTTTTRHNQIK